MAAIVQDDPYQCLMRKIGYSVGLEHVVKRAIGLTDLYVEQRELSMATFRDLVENKFKRKNATEHFADFYGALNLVKLAGVGIYPLHNLETLSILRRFLADNESKFLSAAKLVLTQAILEADGEVFLNALAADFRAQAFKQLIEETVRKKRQVMRNVFKSPSALKKIYSIIDIKSQPSQKSNKSRESEGNTISRFEKRTEPLNGSKRTTSLSDKLDNQVTVPDDYLRKVPATRKGWAEGLGLFENGEKTAKGDSLLHVIDKYLHSKQDTGCYILWPYSKDLAELQLQPRDIEAPDINPWLLLCTIAEGISGEGVSPYNEDEDYTQIVDLLQEFHRLYREGNTTSGSIRHQLPLYIAEPSIVALYSANSENIPPLPQVIDAETKKDVRRIHRIFITGTEGGIVFSKLK